MEEFTWRERDGLSELGFSWIRVSWSETFHISISFFCFSKTGPIIYSLIYCFVHKHRLFFVNMRFSLSLDSLRIYLEKLNEVRVHIFENTSAFFVVVEVYKTTDNHCAWIPAEGLSVVVGKSTSSVSYWFILWCISPFHRRILYFLTWLCDAVTYEYVRTVKNEGSYPFSQRCHHTTRLQTHTRLTQCTTCTPRYIEEGLIILVIGALLQCYTHTHLCGNGVFVLIGWREPLCKCMMVFS